MMIALVTGVTIFAQAQTKGKKTPEQKAAHKLEKMQKQLKLTSGQSTKVKQILLIEDTRIDSLKKTPTHNDKSAYKAKHHAIELTANQQLKTVLTPAQQKLYAEAKAAKKDKNAKKKAAKAEAAK